MKGSGTRSLELSLSVLVFQTEGSRLLEESPGERRRSDTRDAEDEDDEVVLSNRLKLDSTDLHVSESWF